MRDALSVQLNMETIKELELIVEESGVDIAEVLPAVIRVGLPLIRKELLDPDRADAPTDEEAEN